MRKRLTGTVAALVVVASCLVMVPPAYAASWEKVSGDCFNEQNKRHDWTRLVCWEKHKLMGDSSTKRDYWQLHFSAAGHALGGRKMVEMWVEARPKPNSPKMHSDGIPNPSNTVRVASNCMAQTLTVSSGQPVTLGLSFTKFLCEEDRWEPLTPDPPQAGRYSVTWKTNVPKDARFQAEVGLVLPVWVEEGKEPIWDTKYTGQCVWEGHCHDNRPG